MLNESKLKKYGFNDLSKRHIALNYKENKDREEEFTFCILQSVDYFFYTLESFETKSRNFDFLSDVESLEGRAESVLSNIKSWRRNLENT